MRTFFKPIVYGLVVTVGPILFLAVVLGLIAAVFGPVIWGIHEYTGWSWGGSIVAGVFAPPALWFVSYLVLFGVFYDNFKFVENTVDGIERWVANFDTARPEPTPEPTVQEIRFPTDAELTEREYVID